MLSRDVWWQDEEQIRALKDDNAMLAGHKNLSQKIQYVANLKEENTKLLEVRQWWRRVYLRSYVMVLTQSLWQCHVQTGHWAFDGTCVVDLFVKALCYFFCVLCSGNVFQLDLCVVISRLTVTCRRSWKIEKYFYTIMEYAFHLRIRNRRWKAKKTNRILLTTHCKILCCLETRHIGSNMYPLHNSSILHIHDTSTCTMFLCHLSAS